VHTGNLSKGIFKPCSVSISGVLDELRLSLTELLNLFVKFTLYTTKLDFLPDGLFFQFGHLGLGPRSLFLQFNDPIAQRQDLRLQLKVLLTLVEEPLLGILL